MLLLHFHLSRVFPFGSWHQYPSWFSFCKAKQVRLYSYRPRSQVNAPVVDQGCSCLLRQSRGHPKLQGGERVSQNQTQPTFVIQNEGLGRVKKWNHPVRKKCSCPTETVDLLDTLKCWNKSESGEESSFCKELSLPEAWLLSVASCHDWIELKPTDFSSSSHVGRQRLSPVWHQQLCAYTCGSNAAGTSPSPPSSTPSCFFHFPPDALPAASGSVCAVSVQNQVRELIPAKKIACDLIFPSSWKRLCLVSWVAAQALGWHEGGKRMGVEMSNSAVSAAPKCVGLTHRASPLLTRKIPALFSVMAQVLPTLLSRNTAVPPSISSTLYHKVPPINQQPLQEPGFEGVPLVLCCTKDWKRVQALFSLKLASATAHVTQSLLEAGLHFLCLSLWAITMVHSCIIINSYWKDILKNGVLCSHI